MEAVIIAVQCYCISCCILMQVLQ